MLKRKSCRIIFVTLLFVFTRLALVAQTPPKWGDWTQWGQLSDSTYCNPVIPSDYSDIDCIKVGDDYYAISSTFQFSPGITILHSKDLVNWRICGHAVEDLTQIGKELNWDRMNRYGRGIWAGTIRYHNNRFYIYFGTPEEGYFMTSAARPEGPWEPLHCMLPEPGWDDCSVLWDEKGNGCFIGTHFADQYKTYLFKLSPDGKTFDRSSGVLVNSGSGREASKLIKVGEWYYLVFSEHKDGIGRYVMAKRSKKLFGPYKEEKQLAQVSREAMEPNQGGIVPGENGEWYFLTHHGSGDWSGRIVSLLPVTWVDGWPLIGKVLPEGIGTMVWQGKMPFINRGNHFSIARSDDFDEASLPGQWQWNYQPRKEMYSLQERPGWLRLKAYTPLRKDDLMKAGNTLTQRCFRSSGNEVTVKMDISNMADGQKSGLCHFSKEHAAIGVIQDGNVRRLEYRKNGQKTAGAELQGRYIWLRSVWGLDGLSRFSYSLDGDRYLPFGEPYQLMWGNYRGDRLGLYSFNDNSESGFVDIDYFHYSMNK